MKIGDFVLLKSEVWYLDEEWWGIISKIDHDPPKQRGAPGHEPLFILTLILTNGNVANFDVWDPAYVKVIA